MLSYQHGFHAGNRADLHKHTLLLGVLGLLTKKARPLTYIESHAGRGLYDLTGAQAQKTGEWREGIGAIYDQQGLATPLARYRDVVARWNRGEAIEQYPGSPCFAGGALRKRDRLVLFERHPQEFAALEEAMTHYRHAVARHEDGYEGLINVFADHDPRHRLVAMIDPSYEVKEDFTRAPALAQRLIERVPDALILIWYPVLKSGDAIDPETGSLHSRVAFAATGATHSMIGSGMAVFGDLGEFRRPIRVIDRALQAYFTA